MKKLFIHFVLLGALLSFYGCEENSDEDLNFIYPMEVGNQWNYLRFIQTTNFEPDSLAAEYEFNDTTTVISEITGIKNLRDTIETFVLKAVEQTDQGQFVKIDYYQSLKDGLYVIAYHNAGGPIILPKKSKYPRIKFKDYSFSSINELSELIQQKLPIEKVMSDSIIFENPPVQTLKYPLTEGSKWTYRQDHNPWRMDKIVAGKMTINLNSGSFNSYHIKWLYDMDHDGEWDEDIWIDDYISKEGIVKRKISILGSVLTTEMGGGLCSFDYFEEFILTEVYL